MKTRSPQLYDPLVAAGAPEEKARAAADDVGFSNTRLSAYDERFQRLERKFQTQTGWVVGLGIAVLVLAALVLR